MSIRDPLKPRPPSALAELNAREAAEQGLDDEDVRVVELPWATVVQLRAERDHARETLRRVQRLRDHWRDRDDLPRPVFDELAKALTAALGENERCPEG